MGCLRKEIEEIEEFEEGGSFFQEAVGGFSYTFVENVPRYHYPYFKADPGLQ